MNSSFDRRQKLPHFIKKPNNYDEFLKEESKKDYFRELKERIKQLKEREFFPKKSEIFRAFELHSIDKLKVVLIGQDPYKDQAAEGLAFSCANNLLRPSLANIFKELKTTHPNVELKSTSLVSWASQGVLLLNTFLTTPSDEKTHHKIGWETFSCNLLTWLNDTQFNLIFVFLGRVAQQFAHLIEEHRHTKFLLSHPSPLSANISFLGSQLFKKIDEVLASRDQKINWNTT